jgi:hypothetical protein
MASDVIPFIEETEQRGQFAGRLGHVRGDGTPFFAEMLMVVFNDDAGRAMGLVGFATDITEQERTEDELRQYQKQPIQDCRARPRNTSRPGRSSGNRRPSCRRQTNGSVSKSANVSGQKTN